MKKQTFIEYSKAIAISLVITVVTAFFGIIQFYLEEQAVSSPLSDFDIDSLTVVIDAGHGGEDGGAVGHDGTLEKDINLSISKYLYEYFSLVDIKTVMTREEDNLLYEAGQENRKKFNDLNNRLKICNSFDNPILISVHQNKFPLEKYKGLQVYYSENTQNGKVIADLIQNKTKKYLQKENNRQTKAAGRNIFILDKAVCPAVLVECGFLSNPDEEKALGTPEYQRKIAFVIFSSVMDYITKSKSDI